MDARTLRAHMKAHGLSQSELARRVGVSRQAVSLWLRKGGQVNLEGRHLMGVSRALGVPVEDLARALPCFEQDRYESLRARYLWDRLYPDLDDFAIALERKEPRAVARLVEVHGLYGAEKVVGKAVWEAFPHYQRFLHPVRRRQLETLHRWRTTRTAA